MWKWARRFWQDLIGDPAAEARVGAFQDVQLRAWTAAKLEDVKTRLGVLEVKLGTLIDQDGDETHHDD